MATMMKMKAQQDYGCSSSSSEEPPEPVVPWMVSKKEQYMDDSDATQVTMRTQDTDYSDSDDSDSDEDYDSDEDSGYDDLEQEMLCFDLKLMRRRNASRGDTLANLLANKEENKLSRPEHLKRSSGLDLFKRMALANENNSYFQRINPSDDASASSASPSPDQFLKEKLKTKYTTESTFRSKTWEAYFTAVTPERLRAHQLVVASAIRKADLTELKRLVANGARLDGCNRQGESSIHLACRLGDTTIVQYLTQEAKVSVRVRDDCGRTPLHDAAWTNEPNFGLVRHILEQAPELLFLQDFRGYTALHYVPVDAREAWCDWIQDHQDWLREKVHLSSWLKASDDLDRAQARVKRLLERTRSFMDDD